MKRNNAHKRLVTLVTCAMLVAIQVVLVRFCSIQTPFQRISFGFIPMSMAGVLFGPFYSCVVAAMADLLGAILFPTGGAFWPGFTIVAACAGLLYGLLHEKEGREFGRRGWYVRLLIVELLINLLVNVVFGTINLYFMYGAGAFANIPTRLIKNIVMIPIEVVIITTLRNTLAKPLRRQLKF